MRVFRGVVALFVILALAVGVSADDGAQKKKKKAQNLKGVVVAVEKDADKNAGTITLKVQPNKKAKAANPNAEAVEKKIKFTAETKFEKVSGTKGDLQINLGTVADVQKDVTVAVAVKDGQADTAATVQVFAKKKKK